MDVLPLQFRTLKFFGVWSETGNDGFLVKYIWRPFNILAVMIMTMSLLGALPTYRHNVAEFTECLLMDFMFLGLCIKLVNWFFRRDAMLELLEEFRKEECLPRDHREREMIGEYMKAIAMIFKVIMLIGSFCGVLISLVPLIVSAMSLGASEILLPAKTYEIIDKSDRRLFWLTYAFQAFTGQLGIFINVSFDTTAASLLLLICQQIDLCCHRLSLVESKQMQKSVKECVVHQLLIRRIVRKLESFFMPVIIPQMLLSLLILCTTVYNLAQPDVSGVQSLSLLLYIVCLLNQLGCYCWFGNKLKLKSNSIRETIYNSDWMALTVNDRKSLHLIMLCTDREMTLSFHGFCATDLDVFVWVLKASYSAYNLLKTVE